VSGGSGGSTTIGGISVSSRKASVDALNALFAGVAPKLNTTVDALEAVEGQTRQADKPSNGMPRKRGAALVGPKPVTIRRGKVPAESEKAGLIATGVGGAQMADVSVDIETGIVTLNELVAVQDCGLIIDLKTCESQVFGALIMGVTWALFEEAVYDAKTGRM